MDVTSTVLIASSIICITFSFLSLCSSIFAIIRLLVLEKREYHVIPVNHLTGEPVTNNLTSGKKTSGLEKLEKELDALMPKEDDFEEDFNNIGVTMNPRVERTPEEDLV